MDDAASPRNGLLAWLEQDEARSRPARVRRLRHLVAAFGPDAGYLFFWGGDIGRQTFEEARLAYLHGLFIGCILLCQVCAEHTLAGLLRVAGHNDVEGAGFATLLAVARDEGHLSPDEFAVFDRLRAMRNPYTHSRPPLALDGLIQRAVASDTPAAELMAHDAELAIGALLGLFRRAPFSFEG